VAMNSSETLLLRFISFCPADILADGLIWLLFEILQPYVMVSHWFESL
jgi:hypothetical protein